MKITRRRFLKSAALIAACPPGLASTQKGILVNDIHSQINPTWVREILAPRSCSDLQSAVRAAGRNNQVISIAGGRHSMGAQQFSTNGVLIDTRKMDRVLNFSSAEGLIEVEGGIQWPELISQLISLQRKNEGQQWSIAQKQTGADRLTLGGALASNIHGRGLKMKPFGADIESFKLLDAEGHLVHCDRQNHPELFKLAVGGYGLFGVVHSLKLRLVPRQKLQRTVEVRDIDGIIPAFEERIAQGYVYGDFQFAIDPSEDYLRKGVFSCYRPVPSKTPMPKMRKRLSESNWMDMIYLAHTDPKRAFEEYSRYYLSTNGQLYWSDLHQLSAYLDNYHEKIDRRLRAKERATEIITEIYVPRNLLVEFMKGVSGDFRKNNVKVIYGTVRLIEQDTEPVLSWAKQPYACIVFNLHTPLTRSGLEDSSKAFRRLIDRATELGGSFFLTYHKFATAKQVLSCYPNFPEFLRLKTKYDPQERFQSDWYRHYKNLFAG